MGHPGGAPSGAAGGDAQTCRVVNTRHRSTADTQNTPSSGPCWAALSAALLLLLLQLLLLLELLLSESLLLLLVREVRPALLSRATIS